MGKRWMTKMTNVFQIYFMHNIKKIVMLLLFLLNYIILLV
jgi:hypothetical protein